MIRLHHLECRKEALASAIAKLAALKTAPPSESTPTPSAGVKSDLGDHVSNNDDHSDVPISLESIDPQEFGFGDL